MEHFVQRKLERLKRGIIDEITILRGRILFHDEPHFVEEATLYMSLRGAVKHAWQRRLTLSTKFLRKSGGAIGQTYRVKSSKGRIQTRIILMDNTEKSIIHG